MNQMAVDSEQLAAGEQQEDGKEDEDGQDWRVIRIRVHNTVPGTFDVPTALKMFAEDEETHGKLYFVHKPGKPSRNDANKIGPDSITVDTIPNRRAERADVDPEAQKLMGRLLRGALRDPKTGPKLQAVLKRQAAGETVSQEDILGALDAATMAQMLSSMAPRKPRAAKQAENGES